MRFGLMSLLLGATLLLSGTGLRRPETWGQEGNRSSKRDGASPATSAPGVRYSPHPLPSQLLYPAPVYPEEVLGWPRLEASPGLQRYGIPAAALPWNQASFEGYDEPQPSPREPAFPAPLKYSLRIDSLPQAGWVPARNVVLVVFLPQGAALWVEGRPTPVTGTVQALESPPLLRSGAYRYTLRAAWLEGGRWVSQTRDVTVHPGKAYALHLQKEPAVVKQVEREATPKSSLPGEPKSEFNNR
jgi:uncharacterized protein (TIGR03000 family)